MRSKSEIEKHVASLKADERLSYPPASIFANAPLALIQVSLKERIAALEWALEGISDEGDGAVEQCVQSDGAITWTCKNGHVNNVQPETCWMCQAPRR